MRFVKEYQVILTLISLFSLFSLFLLAGCSTFSSSFDCDKVGGIQGCVSMSEVYAQSQAGAFDSYDSFDLPYSPHSTIPTHHQGGQIKTGNIGKIGKISKISNMNSVVGSSIAVPSVGQPVRVGDTVQKIMIFDYIDSDGNYNEPSVVYTVLRGANWLNHSVDAVKAMGDE
ncbi:MULTISPECIES: type IV conjugative transfer system lipoprotein TraV [Cysteiniphilum]|uniref:Type IV conjugative transfer system protein TraV n=3 Tax=Cysteiniphilum litorale TaxID=2056700 RepID=A0A8J3EAM6_9GAMM|nr:MULTISPECIES: type IV conjugative transfer system lipoprotein TraV [Cysteiniphilum]GGG09358.1 hypothetical protein GCM10010995_28740 [Cysteiniphilum litorale]